MGAQQIHKAGATADDAHELLVYNQMTGKFRWRRKRAGLSFNREPGTIDIRYGYRSITIKRQRYYAHRLAWLMVYGEWPDGEIDHIDGDPSNNRISNLRVATRSQQLMNTRGQRRRTSKFKGVRKRRDCRGWMSKITVRGQVICLGSFETEEDAHAAYVSAARRLHGEFANAGTVKDRVRS